MANLRRLPWENKKRRIYSDSRSLWMTILYDVCDYFHQCVNMLFLSIRRKRNIFFQDKLNNLQQRNCVFGSYHQFCWLLPFRQPWQCFLFHCSRQNYKFLASMERVHCLFIINLHIQPLEGQLILHKYQFFNLHIIN